MKLLSKDNSITLGLTLLFFVISLIGIFHHTMWLDESWHYLIAHESESVTDIFSLSFNNGHPKLWNIAVYGLLKVSRSVLAVQVFHSLIASFSAFLIFKFSPFKLMDKCFLVFGYYFLFEYNVIVNHYALGIMFTILALVFFVKGKSLLLIAVCLGLAANCHLFTLILASSLFVYVFSETKGVKQGEYISALLIFGFLISLSVWQIIPSQRDVDYFRSFENSSLLNPDRFQRVFTALTKGLLNLPDFRSHEFWNSNFVSNISVYLASVTSFVLLVLVSRMLRVERKVLFVYIISMGLILSVVFYFPLGSGVRYWGYFYITFVLCYWLIRNKQEARKFSVAFFRAILVVQFLVSFPAYYFILNRPFSNSESAAKTLSAKNYNSTILFAENIGLGFPLTTYSDKAIYYPAIKEFTKCTANNFNRKYQPGEFVRASILDLKSMKLDSCILAMNQRIQGVTINQFSSQVVIKKVAYHTGAIIPSEDYFLYLMKLKSH